MTFPVIFHPFGLSLHAHLVFESLAYFLGFQVFLFLRRRHPTEAVPFERMAWILVGAIFGALVGSKLLAWVEHPQVYLTHLNDLAAWVGGKTIVGGLLGGWAGVEIAKKFLGVRANTGDLYVYPLALAIAVGRVGCFLTGLPDMTYGVATSLPWGVDFGDDVRRHPTQLYEIVALAGISLLLAIFDRRLPRVAGLRFRLFLAGYLAFRFAVEFIKPSPKGYGHLSAIQIASLAGVAICLIQSVRLLRRSPSPASA